MSDNFNKADSNFQKSESSKLHMHTSFHLILLKAKNSSKILNQVMCSRETNHSKPLLNFG